jgi:hypothetical protein
MTTNEAIKLLRNSGSGESLLDMLEKVVSQINQEKSNQPTIEEIEF